MPFNSGLEPRTGLVKDDPLARMMKMTESFKNESFVGKKKVKEKVLFGDTNHGCKNILSLTQLSCSSSDSDSRITISFPRNQGITGESCALKDWYKCFTQSSKEGNDL